MADNNFGHLTNGLTSSRDVGCTLSAKIAARVSDMIRERTAHGLSTFWLAQAGSVLGPELRRLEDLTGRRLIDIVREDLGYDVRSAPNAPHAPFIVLATDATPPTRRQRVPEALWRAFTTPLSAGCVRVFSMSDGCHRDVRRSECLSTHDPIIPRALIHPVPPKHLYDAVAASVRAWLAALPVVSREPDGVLHAAMLLACPQHGRSCDRSLSPTA